MPINIAISHMIWTMIFSSNTHTTNNNHLMYLIIILKRSGSIEEYAHIPHIMWPKIIKSLTQKPLQNPIGIEYIPKTQFVVCMNLVNFAAQVTHTFTAIDTVNGINVFSKNSSHATSLGRIEKLDKPITHTHTIASDCLNGWRITEVRWTSRTMLIALQCVFGGKYAAATVAVCCVVGRCVDAASSTHHKLYD